MAENTEQREQAPTKEDTVSMTILVPVSVHTRVKVAAARAKIPLYQMIIDVLDETFKGEGK